MEQNEETDEEDALGMESSCPHFERQEVTIAESLQATHAEVVSSLDIQPECSEGSPSQTQAVHPGAMEQNGPESPDQAEQKDDVLSFAINEIRQMPNVKKMLEALNLAPQAQVILEQAMADTAI